MRALIVAMLCVSLLGGGVAYADLEKGTYAPALEAKEWMNTDEPVSLTELRGMVVVVVFWVSWHEGGEYVMPEMSIVHSELGRQRGVYLVALTDSDRERVEDMVDEKLLRFPIGLESDSLDEFEISSYPSAVVIDPAGKVQYTGWPGGNQLTQKIFEILEETPPTKTHPIEAAAAREDLAEARKHLRNDDIAEAWRAAKNAHDHALTGDQLKTRTQNMLDLIEALGRDLLARGQRAVAEKRFDEGIRLLRRARHWYHGLTSGGQARRRLESLQSKYPEVKELLEQLNEETRAEDTLARLIEQIEGRKFGEAYEGLEDIVEEFPEAPAAEKAETLMKRMKDNEAVAWHVRNHLARPECEALLSQARAFVAQRRYDRAEEILRRIMDEHSETIYADRAADMLLEIPRR